MIICRLERVIVWRANLFKNVIMPNGAKIDRNCISLTRTTNSNSLVVVKLKGKGQDHNYVLFEPKFVGSF